MGRRWTKEDDEQLKEYAEDGYTQREVMVLLEKGCRQSIAKRASKLNIRFVKSRPRKEILYPIVLAIRSGANTTGEIARIVEKNKKTVYKALMRGQRDRAVFRTGKMRNSRWYEGSKSRGEFSPMPITIDIEQAKELIANGAKFGEVYPAVEESSRELLREWFVNEPSVPKSPVVKIKQVKQPSSKDMGYTGDSCKFCFSIRIVMDGKCRKCMECGNTDGGCS